MDFNLKNISPDHTTQTNIVKMLILGSGPAGLSAALYAARANLEPVVLTGMDLGGQVSLTNTVENYPGFPEGVGGQELVDLFQKQAERFGARIEFDTATQVDLSQRPFKVQTYNSEYIADTIIIATGAQATLAAGSTHVWTLVLAEEYILELHHAGVGKQQRRVVAGNQEAGRHDSMPLGGEVI